MTPQAKLRFDVFREGQIAYGAQNHFCPYENKDWRSRTWQKGYDSAKAYYSAPLPEVGDSSVQPVVEAFDDWWDLRKPDTTDPYTLSRAAWQASRNDDAEQTAQTAPVIPKDIASFIRFMNYTFVPMTRQQEEIKKSLELASTALLKAESEPRWRQIQDSSDFLQALGKLSSAMGSPAVKGKIGDMVTPVINLAADRLRNACVQTVAPMTPEQRLTFFKDIERRMRDNMNLSWGNAAVDAFEAHYGIRAK